MRSRTVSLIVRASVILFVLLPAMPQAVWAAEGDLIEVNLKAFKFNVRAEVADLFGYDDGERRLFYFTSGAGETTVKLPADGDYEVVVRAACDPALGERAKFKLALDGQLVGAETLLTDDDQKDYKLEIAGAKAGERKLAIEFTNDAYKEGEYDRNLYVYEVTVRKGK